MTMVSLTTSETSWQSRLRGVFRSSLVFTVLALVILIITMTVLNPDFLSLGNLNNITRQASINAIIAVGMTFVILEGTVDLSVGSVLALSGTLMAGLMINNQMNPVLAVILGLVAGVICGFVTGTTVAYLLVPGIIASLGMMEITRGLALLYTGGYPLSGIPSSFSWLGNGNIGPLPTPLVLTIIVYFLAYLVLNRTPMGRYVYALGGNEEAVRLSGIKVKLYKALPFMISGFTAALAGAIAVSRMSSGQPSIGTGFELDAIAAVVLGGTSIAGGKGNIWGTLVGALTLAVLSNGLNFIGVSPYTQRVIKGAIIIVAVIIATRSRGRD